MANWCNITSCCMYCGGVLCILRITNGSPFLSYIVMHTTQESMYLEIKCITQNGGDEVEVVGVSQLSSELLSKKLMD